jgi:hypothetical protein
MALRVFGHIDPLEPQDPVYSGTVEAEMQRSEVLDTACVSFSAAFRLTLANL